MSFDTPPDNDDPRDEAEIMEDWAKELAGIAARQVQPGQPGYEYTNDPEFAPHPWVIQALVDLMVSQKERIAEIHNGFDNTLAAAKRDHQTIQDATAADFAAREIENMRAIVAAVLEVIIDRNISRGKKVNPVQKVIIDPNRLPTIWDRFELETKPNANGTVTFTLVQVGKKK